MVKLDNWETKAEKAAERRNLSKQKKQQRDRTRMKKAMAQQLLSFLDEHNDRILLSSSTLSSSFNTNDNRDCASSVLKVHVWTDMVPSSFDSIAFCPHHHPTDSLTDLVDKPKNGNGKKKGRSRSGSLNNPPPPSPVTTKKGRPRSNSDASAFLSSPDGKKKNKGRIRSGSNASDHHHDSASASSAGAASLASSPPPRMCTNHFFGCCASTAVNNNQRRKGSIDSSSYGCAFGWHPSALQKNATLANVLLLNSNNKSSNSKKKGTTTGTPSSTSTTATGDHRISANRQALKASLSAAIAASATISSTILKQNVDDSSLLSLLATSSNNKDNVSMDMLFHLSTVVPTTMNGAPNIVEQITTALSTNSCSVGSITYVVLGDTLLFDRYRGGMVLTESDEESLLFGGSNRRRSVSISSTADHYTTGGGGGGDSFSSFTNSTDAITTTTTTLPSLQESAIELHKRLVLHLPGPVLEYILTFLPTQAATTMSLVCKSWHEEIGTSSPDLWRHYILDRYEWPAPTTRTSTCSTLDCIKNNTNTTTTTAAYRNTFLSHYTAVRDIKAVVEGLQFFENCRTTGGKAAIITTTTKDVALLPFKEALGGSRRSMSGETFVRMWSERRVLVANAQDCSLYLYDVVECNNGQRQRCKQAVWVSVAPFGSRKKRSCNMVAMDMDDHTVGCLYEVMMGNDNNNYDDDNSNETHTWLTVVKRHDLLCSTGAGGTKGGVAQQLEDASLCTYDLEASVLDCILSCDDVEVMNFLYSHGYHSEGFDVSSIEIDIKENIVACGNGEFLLDAMIIMPIAIDDDSVELALSKIFLFSSNLGTVTWVGPQGCSEVHYFDPIYSPRSKLVGANHVAIGNNDGGDVVNGKPSAALVSTTSLDTVVSIRVKGVGDVECATHKNTLHKSSASQNTTPWPELGMLRSDQIPVITPTGIILVETRVESTIADASDARTQTIFSFQPLNGDSYEDRPATLVLNGDCAKFPMQPLRKDHLIVFCENYNSESPGASSDHQLARRLFAVLIHVPSRKVIYDSYVGEVNESHVLAPGAFSLDSKADEVAVSIDEVGMFVAGHGVASSLAEACEKRAYEEKNRMENTKAKKKRPAKQKAKKDGFARGMRQTMG